MPYYQYPTGALEHLQKKDKKLSLAIQRIGIIEREITPEIFPSILSSIVSQQISKKAATTVWARLQELLGEITPENVERTSIEYIQKCGISMRKVGYIKGIAACGVHFSALPSMSDEEIIALLSALPGIGVWTAEMLLIFSLCRPDVVSYGDLAIRRGIMTLYGLKALSKEEFARYKKRYSPYGTVASLYLWELSNQ